MFEQSNKLLIPVAILIAGGLITWGVIITNKQTQHSTENQDIFENSQQELSTSSNSVVVNIKNTDYFLGNPDADLILISFGDFECSFCKVFHQTLHQIIDTYGKDGKVAWVFRQFPIYGVTAEEKALTTKCAGQVGGNTKFWEMSDKIFQTEFSEKKEFVTEQLIELATLIKLDKKSFLACLEDTTVLELVKQEYQSGIEAGVLGASNMNGGTPYTVILTKSGKTYPIEGAQPYNVVKSIIDTILQGD